MVSIERILNSVIFWSAWIIIPLLMEIIPAIASMLLLAKRRHKAGKSLADPAVWPEISIIVPVYNSQDTLHDCIASIAESTYPDEKIRVFLVNNQGEDRSFEVYGKSQKEFPLLHIQWLNAKQGKSRALNLALYNSEGKYIINIDSDGKLEKNALKNLVRKFENDPKLDVMTGTILTRPDRIRKTGNPFLRLLQNCEFMEYAQAFLAGRSYASETDSIYTLSGAFSAFRKSAVLSSWLYNTATISEDTQLTFQMRYLLKKRVETCENAIFYVDPIESLNKLYVQRQRWQRGSLEVAKLFLNRKFHIRNMFRDTNVHTLVYDHTFAFPRLIWYLALILLTCMNYSGGMVLYAFGIIFLLYILVGFCYFAQAQHFMKTDPKTRRYYLRHWWVTAILPVFNLGVFFIRIAGIINSIHTDSKWRTRDLTDEKHAFTKAVKADWKKVMRFIRKGQELVNIPAENPDSNPSSTEPFS